MIDKTHIAISIRISFQTSFAKNMISHPLFWFHPLEKEDWSGLLYRIQISILSVYITVVHVDTTLSKSRIDRKL